MRIINRSWLPPVALIAIALALPAGCSGLPDAYEARTCRRLAPTLEAPGSAIEVRQSNRLANHRVEIIYEARHPDAGPRRRWLVCEFAAHDLTPGDRLARVWLDGEPVGNIRLAFLKRFWLNVPEAAAADPEPYLRFGSVPQVPQVVAIAMQHVLSALPLISIYALLATAYALIYGLLGRINLAFGEFAAIGGYGALLAVALAGGISPWWAVIAACLALGIWTAAMHGLAAGQLVFAPLRRASGQQVLIATVGLAIALREYLRLSQGSALRWVEPILNQPIGIGRSGAFVVTVTPIAAVVTALALAAVLCLVTVMQWSRFGRFWRACADDPGTARLLGVDPSRILVTSFLLASALAGLAGTISTVFYGGLGYAGGIVLGLKSLIAAIAGGIGSVPGALLGGILIGGLETLWSALFPIEYRDLAVYSALAAFLIWRPEGMLGYRDTAPQASRIQRRQDA